MIRDNLKQHLSTKPPTNFKWLNYTLCILGGAFVVSASASISTGPPTIEFVELQYKNGLIGQRLKIHSDKPVPGRWTANIQRGGNPICVGGGTAPYKPRKRIIWMTPSRWTGDKCPPLQKGDVLAATWECLSKACNGQVSTGTITIQ